MSTNQKKLDIEQQIDRYLKGELSSSEIDKLWNEIIQDQKHVDYLNTSANLKEVIHEQENEKSALQSVWMYAAAIVVLLLAVIGTLQFTNFDTPAKVEPIEVIELDYYRSASSAVDPESRDEIIRNAIELYNKNRFDEAVTLLDNERNESTDAGWIAELDITLGTFHYNEDKFEKAAFYFSDVVKYDKQVDVLTLEQAYWYLGNSYLQMNMMNKAEQTMKKALALNGAYSRVAKSFLNAIAEVEK